MLLRARDLSKAYGGRPALAGVSLAIDRGDALGVIGENGAGKSTLVGILGGSIAPDAGTIEWEGRPLVLRSPADAAAAGIGVVHQHDTLVPRFTVAENLGLAAGLRAFPRRAELAARARDLASRFGLDPGDPHAPCESLGVGARQRVEILKALSRPTRLLLLDEPTASLAPAEVAELLRVVGALRETGVAVLLVDHKLHEVREACSRVLVLRLGARIAEAATADSTADALATAMVGHAPPRLRRPPPPRDGSPALSVRDLRTSAAEGRCGLAGVDFDVRRGEVLGVAGVDGNGQHELVASLRGLVPEARASIRVGGEDLASAGRRLAAIPPDRHGEGLLLDLSLEENLVLDAERLREAAPRGWLRPGVLRDGAHRAIERFRVRGPGPAAPARSLSGGNQQKVVVARALAADPAALVAAQPTRGLDVDAAAAVHREILAFAERGGAVVLVSTDLDEIALLAHRVIVLDRGRAVGPFDVPLSPESLAAVGRAMAGAHA